MIKDKLRYDHQNKDMIKDKLRYDHQNLLSTQGSPHSQRVGLGESEDRVQKISL